MIPGLNLSSTNLNKIDDLPTPASPKRTTLISLDYGFYIIFI